MPAPIPQHSVEYAARICPVFRFLTGNPPAAPERPMADEIASAVKDAFATPWELCTAEQRALREAWLPKRENPQFAWETELVSRFTSGLPLSRADTKRARRIIKERALTGAPPVAPEPARLRVIGRIEPPAFCAADFPEFTVEAIALGLTVPATSGSAG